jgi:hypothetical protein
MTDDEDVTMEQEERYRMLRMKEWFVLVGCVVAILGILVEARISDSREKYLEFKLKEAEANEAALRAENDACWKDVKSKVLEVIRFRCPVVDGNSRTKP